MVSTTLRETFQKLFRKFGKSQVSKGELATLSLAEYGNEFYPGFRFFPLEGYKITLVDGLCYQGSVLADTRGFSGKRVAMGHQAYVLSKENTFYIFPAFGDIASYNHSAARQGMPVKAAGLIGARNGKLTSIDDDSGHYLTNPFQLYQVVKFIDEKNAFAPNAVVSLKHVRPALNNVPYKFFLELMEAPIIEGLAYKDYFLFNSIQAEAKKDYKIYKTRPIFAKAYADRDFEKLMRIFNVDKKNPEYQQQIAYCLVEQIAADEKFSDKKDEILQAIKTKYNFAQYYNYSLINETQKYDHLTNFIIKKDRHDILPVILSGILESDKEDHLPEALSNIREAETAYSFLLKTADQKNEKLFIRTLNFLYYRYIEDPSSSWKKTDRSPAMQQFDIFFKNHQEKIIYLHPLYVNLDMVFIADFTPEQESIRSETITAALLSACVNERLYIIKDLINAGADVKVKYSSGKTMLHILTEKNTSNQDLMESLLENGADINAEDADGNNCLFNAHASFVPFLIDRGVDVSAQNTHGVTALEHAMLKDQHDKIEILLQKPTKSTVDITCLFLSKIIKKPNDIMYRTHLFRVLNEIEHFTIPREQLDKFLLILSLSAPDISAQVISKIANTSSDNDENLTYKQDYINSFHSSQSYQGNEKNTFLHNAIILENFKAIFILMQNGADLRDYADKETFTYITQNFPLENALSRKNWEQVAHILNQNTEFIIKEILFSEKVCLITEYFSVNTEESKVISQIIMDVKLNNTSFFYHACISGAKEEVAKLLADPKFDLSNPNFPWAVQAFCDTAKAGQVEIIQLLLEDGRINADGIHNGDTAFSLACSAGHAKIVKLLLNISRVNVNFTYEDGLTDFHIACADAEHLEVIQLLGADNRIDVNQIINEDGYSYTAFSLACGAGDAKVVDLLLKNPRIDVYLTDSNGSTPLMLACREGYVEVVKLLLADVRIDVNYADHEGNTAFEYAHDNDHVEIEQLLLASPHFANKDLPFIPPDPPQREEFSAKVS